MDWNVADINLTQDEEIKTQNGFSITKNPSARFRGGTRITIDNTGQREIQFKFFWPQASQKAENTIHLCVPGQKLSLDIPATQCLVYQWRHA
jgi:hypothetical protein